MIPKPAMTTSAMDNHEDEYSSKNGGENANQDQDELIMLSFGARFGHRRVVMTVL